MAHQIKIDILSGVYFYFFVIIIRDENPKGRGCEASQSSELTSKPRSKPTEWGGAGRQTCLTNGKARAAKSLMAHQRMRQVLYLSFFVFALEFQRFQDSLHECKIECFSSKKLITFDYTFLSKRSFNQFCTF